MNLFKKLLGDQGPSQAELQREADEEIKQAMSQSSRSPADMQMSRTASDISSESQEPASAK